MDRRSPIGPIKKLGRLKDRLKKTRYWTYLWVSISKILIFMARYVKFDIFLKIKKKKKWVEDKAGEFSSFFVILFAIWGFDIYQWSMKKFEEKPYST